MSAVCEHQTRDDVGGRFAWRDALAVLALGFGSQLSQVVLVRELMMVFHGNEVSIGIAFAVWLAWGGVGSLLGAWVAGRGVACPQTSAGRMRRRLSTPLPVPVAAGTTGDVERQDLANRRLMALGLAAGLTLAQPLTIVLLRDVRLFFDIAPGTLLSFGDTTLAAGLLMAPVSILWGAQFVVLAGFWQARMRHRIRGPVNTYMFEAMGNLVGGIAFSLLLVRVLDPMRCVVLSGLLMTIAVAALSGRTGWRWIAGLTVVALIMGLPVLGQIDHWAHARHWRSILPDRPLVKIHPSRYGLIAVTDHAGQHAFYQSGHLAFSTASARQPRYALEEQDAAVLANLALMQHPNPRRILLIGGGLRGVLRALLAHPVESIVYVEMDPALIEAALPYLPDSTLSALDDPRATVVTRDGRMFVRNTRRHYDVVLVDVPDPLTAALNRFYTTEFFDEVRRRLRPDGIMVLTVGSTPGLRDRAAANRNATIFHSLDAVFRDVLCLGDRRLMMIATDTMGQLTADPHRLRTRYRERAIDADAGFSDRHFHALLREEPLRRINWILRHHGRRAGDVRASPVGAPIQPPSLDDRESMSADLPPVVSRYFINRDLRPIGYFHSLIFWHRHTRAQQDTRLATLIGLRAEWLMGVIGAVLLVGVVLRVSRRRRHTSGAAWALGVAVVTTGLSTMTLQMVLLFGFQSQYGYVYEMLGLIAALFMGGLALGAATTRRRQPWRRLAALQVLIALWAFTLGAVLPAIPRLPVARAVPFVFAGLTFLSGLWNGKSFPLALACLPKTSVSSAHSVGVVYAMELLGACAGALLAGVAIIPIMGMITACRFAAALNLTAFFSILLAVGGRHGNTPRRH